MSINIKETINTINQMQTDGVIDRYAIGGAVGATFYLEPADTRDVDIFVALEPPAERSIISIAPIYEYLRGRGCGFEGEYVVISGWPVQFLPASSPLLREALEQSVEKEIDGTPTRVFSAEHLAAIAFELGPPKDRLRVIQFLEARAIDESRFGAILERHNLLDRWTSFKRQLGG